MIEKQLIVGSKLSNFEQIKKITMPIQPNIDILENELSQISEEVEVARKIQKETDPPYTFEEIDKLSNYIS